MENLTEEMADRYGVGKGWASKKLTIAGLVLFAIGALIYLILHFSAAFATNVTVDNTGHTVVSDSEIQLTFTVQGDAGMTVVCHANAVNDNFAEIGAKDVEITLSEYREAHSMVLATSERAAAGQVETCTPK